jgi:hypothetical protein
MGFLYWLIDLGPWTLRLRLVLLSQAILTIFQIKKTTKTPEESQVSPQGAILVLVF